MKSWKTSPPPFLVSVMFKSESVSAHLETWSLSCSCENLWASASLKYDFRFHFTVLYNKTWTFSSMKVTKRVFASKTDSRITKRLFARLIFDTWKVFLKKREPVCFNLCIKWKTVCTSPTWPPHNLLPGCIWEDVRAGGETEKSRQSTGGKRRLSLTSAIVI